MAATDVVAYLDHASGPRLDPRVAGAITAALAWPGSPAGVHEAARAPAEALEEARAALAVLLGADDPDEVILTAGATESRNLAVKGLLSANADIGDGVLATALEHPATLAAAASAGRIVPAAVGGDGRLDAALLARALADDGVAVVCLHHGQEEIGTLQDVATLVAAVRAARPEARIVLDAAATAGLLALDVTAMDVDALVVGGPSLGAPPWTGALWVRPGARLHPLIEGGLQEGGKRAGAEAVPAIAGLGTAARIAHAERDDRARRMAALGARLASGLGSVPGLERTGPADARVPGHLHVTVAGLSGDTLAASLGARGVCVAPGSTCTAVAGRPSPALEAIGVAPGRMRGAVLMTLGPDTRDEEIDAGVAAFGEEAARLRALAPR